MGIGMFLNLLFWGALIYLAFRFFERGGYGGSPAGHGTHGSHLNTLPQSAEEILRQRYARGEITQEQYRQMLETLRK